VCLPFATKHKHTRTEEQQRLKLATGVDALSRNPSDPKFCLLANDVAECLRLNRPSQQVDPPPKGRSPVLPAARA